VDALLSRHLGDTWVTRTHQDEDLFKAFRVPLHHGVLQEHVLLVAAAI
jgi:hypothetical protein